MRKAWPVFILAAVVGVPAAVEGHKNGSFSGQKGSGQANHQAGHHPGNHQGSHQGNMGGVSANVNVRVNVSSITPFGSSHASRPSKTSTAKSNGNTTTKPSAPKSHGTSTTKPPATNSQNAVNVYTGITINLKEFRPDLHHHHHHKNDNGAGWQNSNNNNRKTPSSNGSTPGVAYSPGTGSMSSGYPSSGTTNTGTGGNSGGGSGAASSPGPGTTNTGTEEEEEPVAPSTTKTNDISVEENAGFFNVRGGAANLKLMGKQPSRQPNNSAGVVNPTFVSAEGMEPVQHPPLAKQERVVEPPAQGSLSNTPSTQDTIGQPQPEKGTGLPVVPSLAGLLTFGAMAVVGWKKVF